MKLILLSGGSGSRLWPLSNDSRAKQFLKVLKNEETGEFESMVQRVFRQVTSVLSWEDVIVATNTAQIDMLHSQIGRDIPIVVEPERRDTFPAIALACSYLYSVLGMKEDEVVAVVSVDAYVEQQFYARVAELEKLVHTTSAEMALLGVEPTYPSSKYGYLIPDNHVGYMEVGKFIEKPSEQEAAQLIEQGAFWNSGVFSFSLKLIINQFREKNLPTNYEELLANFSRLPKKSFDFEVVEHLSHIVALPYQGYWKDLGTWNTLTEEMHQPILGNGSLSEDSENTHVINELDLPIKVLGVSNAVVAVSADGILVSDKPASSRMKDMLTEGLFSRPMYEERRWGWYRVLDITKCEGREVLTKRLHIHAGKNLSYQYHHYREETWTIISGQAIFIQDGKKVHVRSGDVLQIPIGSKHAMYAETDVEFIEVQIGSPLVEEDIVRLTYDWKETLGLMNF
ncbi:cupin domain-containing protein [Cytobacillus firmus]|uniref:sugar phosphate nucleotidyltransferase n=1 Tax=Cytobacillus firmus TaxID=1399 RepID=UPI00218A4591|nr:sugar phosphate nucleotidyltransferase [Cytobacillus firmus]URM33464.1 cupin domain-containing protein [Cytobacillus firmus]